MNNKNSRLKVNLQMKLKEKNNTTPIKIEIEKEHLQSQSEGTSSVQPSSLIELFVYGLALGSGERRPILVLKDSERQRTLPVWLNPIDASFAFADFAHQAVAAHAVTLRLFEKFAMRLERCVFTEIRGHHQYVRLEFSGNDNIKELNVRADEAMSLCLAQGAQFFASLDIIQQTKIMEDEITQVEEGLRIKPELALRPHVYLM